MAYKSLDAPWGNRKQERLDQYREARSEASFAYVGLIDSMSKPEHRTLLERWINNAPPDVVRDLNAIALDGRMTLNGKRDAMWNLYHASKGHGQSKFEKKKEAERNAYKRQVEKRDDVLAGISALRSLADLQEVLSPVRKTAVTALLSPAICWHARYMITPVYVLVKDQPPVIIGGFIGDTFATNSTIDEYVTKLIDPYFLGFPGEARLLPWTTKDVSLDAVAEATRLSVWPNMSTVSAEWGVYTLQPSKFAFDASGASDAVDSWPVNSRWLQLCLSSTFKRIVPHLDVDDFIPLGDGLVSAEKELVIPVCSLWYEKQKDAPPVLMEATAEGGAGPANQLPAVFAGVSSAIADYIQQ